MRANQWRLYIQRGRMQSTGNSIHIYNMYHYYQRQILHNQRLVKTIQIILCLRYTYKFHYLTMSHNFLRIKWRIYQNIFVHPYEFHPFLLSFIHPVVTTDIICNEFSANPETRCPFLLLTSNIVPLHDVFKHDYSLWKKKHTKKHSEKNVIFFLCKIN